MTENIELTAPVIDALTNLNVDVKLINEVCLSVCLLPVPLFYPFFLVFCWLTVCVFSFVSASLLLVYHFFGNRPIFPSICVASSPGLSLLAVPPARVGPRAFYPDRCTCTYQHVLDHVYFTRKCTYLYQGKNTWSNTCWYLHVRVLPGWEGLGTRLPSVYDLHVLVWLSTFLVSHSVVCLSICLFACRCFVAHRMCAWCSLKRKEKKYKLKRTRKHNRQVQTNESNRLVNKNISAK